MSNVDRLLADYIAEHRSGGDADPRAYVARAAPDERVELAALIDAYLARAPRRSVDLENVGSSGAHRTVDELERALAGQSGLWPAVLPRLRHQAGLRRSELVARLAGALGVDDGEEKVAGYYHQMEQGLLPAAGVSDRVLEALAGIVGESAQALRNAGRALGAATPGAGRTSAAFARRTYPEGAAPSAPALSGAGEPTQFDEVDELFRGGRGSGSGT